MSLDQLDQYSQNIILSGKEFDSQKQYWLEKLRGEIIQSVFPAGTNSNRVEEEHYHAVKYEFKPAVHDALVAMSKNSPFGIYMILLATFKYLLYRYTGNEDIIVAMPVFKSAAQTHSINDILLLRTTVTENGAFKDLLLAVKQTVTEADKHSHFPYDKLAELLGLDRRNDGTPHLKTVVLLEQIHDPQKLKSIQADTVLFFSIHDSLELTLEYNTGLYQREMMEGAISHFGNVLTAITQNPNIGLAEIEILSDRDKQRILFELNNTQADYPKSKTIHRLFAEQAERIPDQTAITFQEQKLSYRELNERSNQLARRLKEYGVRPDQIIGIMAERSLGMITAIMAVLKSGGAYLPIDPDYPAERINYMLEDSGTKILLTQTAFGERLTNQSGGYITIDLDNEDLYQGDASNLDECNAPADLAYVIYTSGTTGKSKGAMIEHRNVVRLMFNDRMQFDFNDSDIWTMFHSFCFDFSVWEIYGALLYGGRLIIVPKFTAQDPKEYLNLLKKHQVTVLNQTPTAFYSLIHQELQCADHALAIRYVIFGGEALKPVMLKEWRLKYPDVKLINMYGITETTVHVTYKEITETEIELNISNIGKPIPTLTTYIMDQKLRLLPVGAIGELCVGGDGVGRGYLNRPELTAEKFVSNPFTLHPSPFKLPVIYRSGDLGRFLPDGDLEYCGRIDHQVKIRGHRIELGEIESVLLSYGPVKEVVVLVGEDANQNKYICAYYVTEKDLTVTALRDYMAHKLPEYMIPSYFIRLEKIPMTVNHKIDRKALPKPDRELFTGEAYEAPRNEMETMLVQIWQEVLDVEQIGISGGFFHLGGDSIKAINLLSKTNKILGSNLQIKDIYLNQTIMELSEYIRNANLHEFGVDLHHGLALIDDFRKGVLADVSQAGKLPGGFEDFYPLSQIQQGMVFFTRLRPEERIYHDQFPYLLKMERFDINVFNDALRYVVHKHSILRTVFNLNDFKEPLQIVHGIDSSIIPRVRMDDLQSLNPHEQETMITRYLEADLRAKFELNNDLLWRLRIFNLGNHDYCIVLSCHHAILDGWSVASLMNELLEVLRKLFQGETPEMQTLMSSYRDYVALNLSRQASPKVREFWSDLLAGYSRNKLPFNISSKKINNTTGSRILHRIFDSTLLKNLEEKAKSCQYTLQEICLAAHIYLLGIVTTENDIVTGVVSHDRPAIEDSEKVLGCFLNTIPVRVKVENEVKKTDLLDTIKNVLTNVKAHELFLADIGVIIGENGSSGNPVFDTIFNFTNFHVLKDVNESGFVGQTGRELDFTPNEMTNTLFDLEISKTFDIFVMQIKYAPNYFHGEDIQAAADLYQRILEKFAFDDGEYINVEELLTNEQIKEIVYDFNNTNTDYPKEKTMHRLFEEQAQQTPDDIALVFGGDQLTYRELNTKANQLARLLMEKGIRSGDHVALITQRGLEMIIGMFAILKCGGAYVPIDPEYPLARQEYIAGNSKVSAVLADQEYDISHENTIIIDQDRLNAYPSEDLNLKKDSRDLAYVIYTSGSTGVPKGVMIEHHAAVNLIRWVNREFHVNRNDALLFITSMCFDLSVYDVFGILAAGGRVVITRKEQVQNPEELQQLLVGHRITFWDSVPSTMNYLVSALEGIHQDYLQTDLRLVFLSGDWIPVSLPGRISKYFPNARVISLGGATEGTVWSIYYPVTGVVEHQNSIPYGHPIDNNYFYILDRNLRTVPKGVAGELYIGGVGVARGYMNDEARTQASFIRNRFLDSSADGDVAMMYRTGDLGRMLPDGNIEFLGRADHQVKIRGYRVELGEIENRLLKHDAVKEAVVVDRTDQGNNKYLCAYVVMDETLSSATLKEFLAQELPDYMIPGVFTRIDRIPLTANGKIDRKALPETQGNIHQETGLVMPRDEKEAALVAIWREVLAIEQVGIDDNFFELGGHSLKATVLVSQIHKTFNSELPLREVFAKPTIREQMDYLREAAGNGYVAIQPVTQYKAYPVGCYPLSAAQKRLYVLQQFETSQTNYNLPGAIVIEGEMDRTRLETAFQRLIQRHESLRTSFELLNGEPIQRIHQSVAFEISYQQAEEITVPEKLQAFFQPFDLGQAPLFRAELIGISAARQILIYDLHHIISDGTSMAILIQEFIDLYETQSLPELRIQYKDYAVWQNHLIHTGAIKQQENYWLQTCSGELPALNLPLDYPRPVVRSFEGDQVGFEITPEITRGIHQIATETGATVYMVLLAALNVMFYQYTGQEDIIIGSPIAGRPHADLEKIIGMFVNTLAMRNYPGGVKTFRAFLAEVKENSLKAYENQDYQFEELVEILNLRRDLSRNPLFDVMLVLQNITLPAGEFKELRVLPYALENKTTKFDLTIQAFEGNERIYFSLEYCSRLFKAETMIRLTGHLTQTLAAITANPDIQIKDIEIIAVQEKRRILYDFNNTDVTYPNDVMIHELFEEQAAKTPDHIAVIFQDQAITFRELNASANKLARMLRNKGIKPESVVAIMMKRSLTMIISVLGILKAGGAYLPIDPAYPASRINYVLNDADTQLLLTDSPVMDGLLFTGEVVQVPWDELAVETANLPKVNQPTDLAYIIYTSGTTGYPKGVMIEHRSIANTILWRSREYQFSGADQVLHLFSYSFDGFLTSFFAPVVSGATIVMPTDEEAKNPLNIKEYLISRKITHFITVPALYRALLEIMAPEELRFLRMITLAGDKIDVDLVSISKRLNPELELINEYGPTENSVASTFLRDILPEAPVSIGRPIANSQVYIVNPDQKLQPIGIYGEIWLSGHGLARGYLKNPELTAEKFVPNPFDSLLAPLGAPFTVDSLQLNTINPNESQLSQLSTVPTANCRLDNRRVYKTGDLARWLPDGNIEFLGRMDHQVKIRGFRIELGEIEGRLLKHEAIKEALVIAGDDGNGGKYLCAYFVGNRELTVQDLRDYLAKELPDYMIPAYFVQLANLPLTSNGKLDRKQLPEPQGRLNTGVEYVAPQNELEQRLTAIWEELLGRERVGIHDNFFEIGGNSLSIVKLQAILEPYYPGRITVIDLFTYPTIFKLAQYLIRQNIADHEPGPPVKPGRDGKELDRELNEMFDALEKGQIDSSQIVDKLIEGENS